MKKLVIVLAALGLILAACTPKPTETPAATAAQSTTGEVFELYLVADEQMSVITAAFITGGPHM